MLNGSPPACMPKLVNPETAPQKVPFEKEIEPFFKVSEKKK